MKKLGMIAALVVLGISTPASAKQTYIEYSLDSSDGQMIPWKITLDDGSQTADVTINNRAPRRTAATFYADHVQFYVGRSGSYPGMRMDISRRDLTISRYSNGETQPPNTAQCKLAAKPKLAF